jgi:hypothetical protein
VNGTEVSAGTLTFTTDGALNVVRTTSVAPVRFEGIAAPQTIAVDFGRSIAEGGSGFDSTISVHGETTVAGEWQDGAACGGQVIEPTPCTWPLPHATTHMIVTANLDARMAEVPVLTAPWSLLWPFTTSNFTILTSVYDSLGESHALGLHFRRTTAGTWDYHAVIDETDAASPSPNATEVGAGKLSFDATGQLLSVDTSVLLQLSFPNATPNQFIALDFGKTTNADGLGHMTELAATSTELPTLQDGRALVGDQARATSICE